jgi:hypothetical protein
MALLIQQYKLPQSLLFGKFGAVRMKLPINPVFREIFGGRLFPKEMMLQILFRLGLIISTQSENRRYVFLTNPNTSSKERIHSTASKAFGSSGIM